MAGPREQLGRLQLSALRKTAQELGLYVPALPSREDLVSRIVTRLQEEMGGRGDGADGPQKKRGFSSSTFSSIGVEEAADGTLRLTILDDARLATPQEPPSAASAAATPVAVRDPQPSALPPPSLLGGAPPHVWLALVCAVSLAWVAGAGQSADTLVQLQRDLGALSEARQGEMQALRAELSELKSGIAAMLTANASLSSEQVAELLALRRVDGRGTGQASAEEAAAEEEGEEEGWLWTIFALLFMVLLVLPTGMLVLYERKLAQPKLSQPDFTWHEQIEYRIDCWLSNYESAKVLGLLMISGMLTSFGALVYHLHVASMVTEILT
jgi:hypothetical protein